MDSEKTNPLQATSDVEPLISGSFLVDGHLTDLYLYPHELKLMQKNKTCTIPIEFDLTFAIVAGDQGPIGLELRSQNEKIQLLRDFWPRAEEWEKLLLKHITRKDFHEFFKPIKKIGKGNFASVYLSEDLGRNCLVAVKAFMKETAYKGDGKRSIENEIKVMRMLSSESIAQLNGVYETKNSLYLSMEYLEGTTLEIYLRRNKQIPLQTRKIILRALLIGLRDLKKLRVVHRDLKPENIIICPETKAIKIIDFGLATCIDEPSYIFIRCGTPGFIAPEILKIKDLATARLGVESDMFSVGAIYYRMLYGKAMFPGNDQQEVLHHNKMMRVRLPESNGVYGEMELLKGMLEVNPSARITPEQALQHVFLREKRIVSNRLALRSLQNMELSGEWDNLDE